jgi:hypothetical protein
MDAWWLDKGDSMETVVRSVRDLDQNDRSALERIVGHELAETEQVAVTVVKANAAPSQGDPAGPLAVDEVPEWWKIYEGLTEQEIDELDRAIRQRADLTRDTP